MDQSTRRARRANRAILYREALRQTRNAFTPETVRIERQIKAINRTSTYLREGDGRYGLGNVRMENGVPVISFPLIARTSKKSIVSSAGIPDSRVIKTDKTEYVARRESAYRKAQNHAKLEKIWNHEFFK